MDSFPCEGGGSCHILYNNRKEVPAAGAALFTLKRCGKSVMAVADRKCSSAKEGRYAR